MTHGELEKIPGPLVDIFSDLEIRIMSDIVRRIKINGFSTATADWEMTRLQQLGKSEEDIKAWVRAALSASDKEIENIFSDTVYEEYMGHARAYKVNGMEQIPYKDNIPLQQLAASAKKQISQEYQNLANSMGFAIRNPTGEITYSPLLEYYRTTLDNAVIDIHSGAFSYQEVLEKIINQMTSSGLRWIDYDSGWHNRIDVAVRRAVMTGFRQVQGYINEQVANDLNTDSYEVSYHRGARPSHQIWQGRVYTMQQLKEICGLGTVTGLHGANCYHDYTAFIPGASVRTYTDKQLDEMNAEENKPKTYLGKEYTTYEALQQQRKMETTMRKYRQDIKLLQDGEGTEDSIILKKARYQGKMQEYEAFSKSMGLPMKKERVYQDGLKGKFGLTKKEKEKLEKRKDTIKADSKAKAKFATNKKPRTIDEINKDASEKLLQSYDERRKHYNLNETPAEELKNSALNPVKADYTGVSVDAARRFDETIQSLADEYYSGITSIKVEDKKNTFGAQFFSKTRHNNMIGQKELILNPHKMDDYDKMVERVEELSMNGYCIKLKDGKAGEYIPTHEFAHGLIDMGSPLKNYIGMDTKQQKKIRKEIKGLYEQYKQDIANAEEQIARIKKDKAFTDMTISVEEQMEAFKRLASAQDDLRKLRISRYSMENADEFMAEAFAQAKIGEYKSVYADKVMGILDKNFRKYDTKVRK